jgi:hypothetical protein
MATILEIAMWGKWIDFEDFIIATPSCNNDDDDEHPGNNHHQPRPRISIFQTSKITRNGRRALRRSLATVCFTAIYAPADGTIELQYYVIVK